MVHMELFHVLLGLFDSIKIPISLAIFKRRLSCPASLVHAGNALLRDWLCNPIVDHLSFCM